MGKDFYIGGSPIGHARIEAKLLFPELADPGSLFGFESGHGLVDVRLVATSIITLRKRIPVDAGEELSGIGFGCSSCRLLQHVSSLLRRGLFFWGEPFRSISHDTFVDKVGLLFHSRD